MNNGIGRVWAVNAEGGDEGRPNGVGPVWIENADQLGSKLPEPESGDAGKVLGVLNSSGDIGWVVDQSGTFTQVQADWDETDSSKASYIDNKPSLATVATSGSYNDLSNKPDIPTYTAGDGIAISEQGAISAVGGTGLTVTAESTTTQSITVHTQDYAYSWMPGTEYHSVTYVSALDSSLVSDIQNGGIDVTLSHSFYQDGDSYSSTNTYLTDWQNNPNQFKAYAAIVYLSPHGATTPTAYFGSIGRRLVLGEISAPWIDNTQGFPAIAANTVVSYDFDDVNTTLSTITLSDVLANPSDYCMTVLLLDERITKFDNGAAPGAPFMADVTGAGNYTTGTLAVTVPGAINVTNPVPTPASGDAGKVLTVNSGATGVEWATVQSGSTYTAGDGIDIDNNNRISVNPDSTLKSVYTTRNMDVSTMENIGQNAPAYIDLEGRHSNEVLEHVINDFPLDSSIQVRVIFGTGLYCDSLGQGSDVKAYLIFSDDPSFNGYYATPYELSTSYDTVDNRWVLQSQTVVVDTPIVSHDVTVVGVRPTNTLCYVSFAFGTSLSALTSSTVARQDSQASVQLRITYPDYTSPVKIGVSNPLPTSAVGDAGKVLKVDSNGDPEWATGSVQADWSESDNTDPSYIQNKPDVISFVAGSGISITESTSAITIAADAQLPSYNTTTDVGKVLQVTANGLEWVSLS